MVIFSLDLATVSGHIRHVLDLCPPADILRPPIVGRIPVEMTAESTRGTWACECGQDDFVDVPTIPTTVPEELDSHVAGIVTQG
jgi:hypothetical protein